MDELTLQDAWDVLTSRAALPTSGVDWPAAVDAVHATLQARERLNGEAVLYYVGEGTPMSNLADEALSLGAQALEAATSVQLAVYGDDPGDVHAERRRRFQDLLLSSASELPATPKTEYHKARRILEMISHALNRGRASVQTHDAVQRHHGGDDLLEAAGLAWLLAEIIVNPGMNET